MCFCFFGVPGGWAGFVTETLHGQSLYDGGA